MLNKIIKISLHNRIKVLVAAVLVVIGGMYSAYKTEVDVFPDLNAPTVVIMTEAGGMATEEVEQMVRIRLADYCRQEEQGGAVSAVTAAGLSPSGFANVSRYSASRSTVEVAGWAKLTASASA